MTTGQAIAFVLFAVVAAITPGPSNLMLASVPAPRSVYVVGLPTLVGQVVGMGLMLFLVAFGLGSLILKSPLIIQGLKWCGVGLLLWLAWKIATSERGEATADGGRVRFWGAAAFQWVNPKAWLVCVGAVGTYFQAHAGNAFGQSISLSLLFIVAALPSCFVWLAAGASVQRLLRTERASRLFNVTMGALLGGSIILVIW